MTAVIPASGAAPTGDSIVADAQRYVGRGYLFGGAPATGLGNWDCSSFCNWVIGHDFGMAIPGYPAGKYTGAEHGPDTIAWATWNGTGAVSAPQPGDLVIWAGSGTGGHMGIVSGAGQMISALNSRYGTAATPVQGYGPQGITPVYRRLGLTGGGAIPVGCLPGAALIAWAMIHVKHSRLGSL